MGLDLFVYDFRRIDGGLIVQGFDQLVLGSNLGFQDLNIVQGTLNGQVPRCEVLGGDSEGLNSFFNLGDPMRS